MTNQEILEYIKELANQAWDIEGYPDENGNHIIDEMSIDIWKAGFTYGFITALRLNFEGNNTK